MVFASISLTGNLSADCMSSTMHDFNILKSFALVGKSGRVCLIKKINWFPPLCNWVICNTDGAVKGAPGPAACGVIFMDHSAATLSCFVENLGITFALHAELIGAIYIGD